MTCCFRLGLLLTVGFCGLFAGQTEIRAQVQESFEGQQREWRIRQWDSALDWSQTNQGFSTRQPHSGSVSYHFQLHCGEGQKILASYDVHPAVVIPELSPSLYVHCSRPGVRLLARVVLPHTRNPSGEGPLTTLVAGRECQQASRWTRLDFQGPEGDSLHQRLKRQLPLLRKQYGSQITDRDAYVDALVLNLYGGPGQQEVFIDTLSIEGFVSADRRGMNESFASDASEPQVDRVGMLQEDVIRPSRTRTDGTVVLIDERPFVIRAIEYNGEPLGLLAELGFNTLWLSEPPTADQLRLARQQRLWLIAPPPLEAGLTPIDARHDVVLAWLVGQRALWNDQVVVRQRIDAIRQVDVRQGRPVLVHAKSGLADYARAAEILCVGQTVVGTTFALSDYGPWLRDQQDLAQAYTPLLAEIPTELPAALLQQVRQWTGIDPPAGLQYPQIRGIVFQAIAGGARGFFFRSRTRLDQESPVNASRRLYLSAVNQQLRQLAPWTAGGVVTGGLVQTDPQLQVHTLQTSRSRLLLVQQVSGRESYTAGLAARDRVVVRDPSAGVADQPYRLTPQGLSPATHQRQVGQLSVQLENAADWEVVVLTQDPLVTRYVEQASQPQQTWSGNQLQVEMAQSAAQWATRLQSALLQAGREPPRLRERVGRIVNLSQSMEPLVGNPDPLAIWSQGNQLHRELGQMHDEMLLEAHQMFGWPTGSPLVMHPMLLPLHWHSLSRMADVQWSPNALPGGDFEDLNQASGSGWLHQSAPGLAVRGQVQLHADAAVDGRRGLLLRTQPDGGLAPRLLESAPLWIVSAPVEIPARHVVRIAGHVRIDEAISGSREGFVIQDSLGGPDLSQRIRQTRGWQSFVLYRATGEAETLRLNFILTGYGTVLLDEVTVQIAPLPSPSTTAAPGPLNTRQSQQSAPPLR